jgi:CxxC motif-containing protein (DUF1111 family)
LVTADIEDAALPTMTKKTPTVAFTLALVAMLAVAVAGTVVARSGCSPARSRDGAVSVARLTLNISGTIVDARDRALAGVTVRAAGPSLATVTTDASGAYSIAAGNAPDAGGPWSVRANLVGCTFAPSMVKVNRLTPNTIVNFRGAGEGCVGTISVSMHHELVVDPGPRPGAPGAGGPPLHDVPLAVQLEQAAIACIPGLAAPMLHLCEEAFIRFQKVDSVSGKIAGEEGAGLGPTFNGNSCAMCHSQPAILGSAPAAFSPQNPAVNPQVALATRDGATNVVPPFITTDGPIRVARFKSDNDVHDLFTIAGRRDAHGCAQPQPDFAANLAKGNVSFRIPLALFGLGLVEGVSEGALEANLAVSRSAELGIAGTFNRSSDGTIARFGRKAQDKSLLLFAGQSYNLEIGVTNEIFPEERNAAPGCTFNGIPEDTTDPTQTGSVSETSSDIENFAIAIRLSTPPRTALPAGVTQDSVDNGRTEFESIGCANCHTPTLTTATSNLDPALSKVSIHPFSDFALHHMGSGLADGIVQGAAGPDQFRTTPLWGVGQRLFFLHDGRTSDLVDAVQAHLSAGSEANVVITNFNVLSGTDQQDLVNFLRSL